MNARIQGAWGWEVAVSKCFGFAPPLRHVALAARVGQLTGCRKRSWSVSSNEAGYLTYLAKLSPSGEPHPLLKEIVLEVNENSGSVFAVLTVAEERRVGERRPPRSSLSFQFPADAVETDLSGVQEFLRPYDLRLRSMPIPGSASSLVAPSILPMPSVGAGGAGEDLPMPSGGPQEN